MRIGIEMAHEIASLHPTAQQFSDHLVVARILAGKRSIRVQHEFDCFAQVLARFCERG